MSFQCSNFLLAFICLAKCAIAQTPQPTNISTEGIAGVSHVVWDMVEWDPDGDGPQPKLLVVGGEFRSAGGFPAKGIATWDGAQWQRFDAGMPNMTKVTALAEYEGSLFAAIKNSTGIAEVRKWEDGAWIIAPFSPLIPTLMVTKMLSWQDKLVLSEQGLALSTWDGTSQASLGNFTGGTDDIEVWNGDLYACGSFSAIDGQTVSASVVRRDVQGWVALAPQWYFVYQLAVADGTLYAAANGSAGPLLRYSNGNWTSLGQGTAHFIDLTGGDDCLWAIGSGLQRFSLGGAQLEQYFLTSVAGESWFENMGSVLPTSQGVYVGGPFTMAGAVGGPTQTLTHGHVAFIDNLQVVHRLASHESLGTQSSASVTTRYPQVSAVREIQGSTWAVGKFTHVHSATSPSIGNVALLDENGVWQPQNDTLVPLKETTPAVTDAIEFQGDIYVCGAFRTQPPQIGHGIARWDGNSWNIVGGGFTIPDLAGGAFAMTVFQNKLVVGGMYNKAAVGTNLTAWDGNTWSRLGTTNLAPIDDVAVFNDNLYVAGVVATSGPTRGIARWNGTSFVPLATGLQMTSPSSRASRLQVYDGKLYVTGGFNSAGNQPGTIRIARWDGSTWSALQGTGRPGFVLEPLMSMAVSGQDLLVAGAFNGFVGAFRYNDIDGWRDFEGLERIQGSEPIIKDISVIRNNIYIGGEANSLGGVDYRSGPFLRRIQYMSVTPVCDVIDFNNDTSLFDPQDIEAFLSVYSEAPCIPDTATCNDIDFNNDGSLFDPCDIDSFLVVFSEGPCTPCGV